MALDEPHEKDQIFVLNGITYLVDANLLSQTRPIKVDFIEDVHSSGFAITSRLSSQQSCGSCSC